MSICFAILAHDCPQCVADLLSSIRHFCPGALPVLYDGSGNPWQFRRLDVPVCPSSRPLRWGHTAGYVLETMMWVVREGWAFDFFVVLDSDMLLINPGYEAFLQREMGDSEYMAVDFRRVVMPDTDWRPGQEVWQEWSRWGPLLGAEVPSAAFNPGQAFRRSLVTRIVQHPRRDAIRQAMETSKVVSLDEIVYPTLARVLGARPKSYPSVYSEAVRYSPWEGISLEELHRLRQHPDRHMVHPVPRVEDDPVRHWLRELVAYTHLRSRCRCG